MQVWNVLLISWNITVWTIWFGHFDIEALKSDIETGMYFDSSIHKDMVWEVAAL
jgi:hypothetical protein